MLAWSLLPGLWNVDSFTTMGCHATVTGITRLSRFIYRHGFVLRRIAGRRPGADLSTVVPQILDHGRNRAD